VLSALRVVEGAIVTVSGVMGVEVGTERVWRRCDELGLSRLVLINLLDRERANFATAMDSLHERLSDRCVAVEIPIGSEHEFTGVVDLVHMVAYIHGEDASGHDEAVEIPEELRQTADEYHDRLMDVVCETSDELMERYLEGGEISREEMAEALKKLVTEGRIFPVGCGAATRNIGAHGLLDLIVEGLPSPARARNVPDSAGAQDAGLRVQDDRRPLQRQDQPDPGVRRHDQAGHGAGRQPHARQGAAGAAADPAG
jgi:elongation factor G